MTDNRHEVLIEGGEGEALEKFPMPRSALPKQEKEEGAVDEKKSVLGLGVIIYVNFFCV
jgi:hypothetical protein